MAYKWDPLYFRGSGAIIYLLAAVYLYCGLSLNNMFTLWKEVNIRQKLVNHNKGWEYEYNPTMYPVFHNTRLLLSYYFILFRRQVSIIYQIKECINNTTSASLIEYVFTLWMELSALQIYDLIAAHLRCF